MRLVFPSIQASTIDEGFWERSRHSNVISVIVVNFVLYFVKLLGRKKKKHKERWREPM